MIGLPSVLVLGGGPDAEREISLRSAAAVEGALVSAGHGVYSETIETIGVDELAAMPGDVVFPVLHGAWGEGGPLQDVLEASGRAFVGCGSGAARLAMDKIATKVAAAEAGLETPGWRVLNVADAECPLRLPVVVKPVHEGSSVGLMICRDEAAWAEAHGRAASGVFGRRVFMVESMVRGREVTVGLIGEGRGLRVLPIVEIVPAGGVYDYEAKYTRGDTAYVVDPELPGGVVERLVSSAGRLAERMGLRHLSRVDFIVDEDDRAWLLEVNTMPGFTETSLLPKAAACVGLDLPGLVSRLVRLAKNEHDESVKAG